MTLVLVVVAVLVAVFIRSLTGTFVAGYTAPFKTTPSGGSEQTIQVVSHSWQEMVDKIDITHTGSGGLQALLAGIFRGTGNVKAFLDSSAKYYATTVGIRAGTNALLKHYVTSSLSYTVPGMIVKVNSAVAVNGGVEYDFDFELNSEAGTFSYPS